MMHDDRSLSPSISAAFRSIVGNPIFRSIVGERGFSSIGCNRVFSSVRSGLSIAAGDANPDSAPLGAACSFADLYFGNRRYFMTVSLLAELKKRCAVPLTIDRPLLTELKTRDSMLRAMTKPLPAELKTIRRVVRRVVPALLFVWLTSAAATAQELAPSKTFTEEIQAQREKETASAKAWDEARRTRSEKFGKLPDDVPPELKLKFDQAFEAYRASIIKLNRVYLSHQVAFEPTGDVRRLYEFSDALDLGQRQLAQWRSTIADIFAVELADKYFLRELMLDMIVRDASKELYDGLLPLARALWDHGDPDVELIEQIGKVAYAENDYDLAEKAWQRLKEKQELKPIDAYLLKTLPEQKLRWAAEQAARQADAQRDDNPRVTLLTNKGRFTVELFENEAPQAVANFIHLVEKRFYDKKTFFRVVDRFGAQTGCERGDGTGDAGYRIRGEMDTPNHRCVFRGSLVLLAATNDKTGELDRDSGSSQFAVSSLPQPGMDGRQTVFGRVIEGLQVLGTLERIDLSKEEERKNKSKSPDILVEARVVRKRDHAYQPEPVAGRLR